eukprot:Gregarina_sp_Poly_1__11072@NODE_890_length_5837_cov_53_476430_g634_i0_p8_GENE_NODE_890_length_5837_cov_53_476430_g634_i0NODE_890_length_5837_cov_53_476430_g634_i0_p8_ORF_typecomplete_len115_score18_27MafB19deam/PF14437_6/4_6e06PriX/PF18689_1/0_084_NODE_890_length_5837_cov_53_476430_g634_i031963540
MCSALLMTLGVQCVVYGCANDRFGGTGSVLSQAAMKSSKFSYTAYGGYQTYAGLRQQEAIEILQEFYERGNTQAPEEKRKRNLISSLSLCSKEPLKQRKSEKLEGEESSAQIVD